MAARLTALLPRLLALVVIWLLATSTFTLAAGNKQVEQEAAGASPAPPPILRVPDVRDQAYVFAKGILQDAGFAWRVEGSVQGYAANTVTVQNPAPGIKVVDNGAPTVVLRLALNPKYGERGLPENSSSYAGTKIVLASTLETKQEEPAKEEPPVEEPPEEPTTEPAPDEQEAREPDFEVPGAPAEPAKEIPLPERALQLGRRLEAAKKPTDQLVSRWLYQHAWIVTGARFGWADGAEALRVLIRIDERLQRRWGFGARSEAIARRALTEVESKAK
jgi:beta-lactam-binding protein with PASTA domain